MTIGNFLFFNNSIVSKEELEAYSQKGFLNEEFKAERYAYIFIFIFTTILNIVSLILFYNLRNSYIVRQRNFGLTFAEGIFIAINLFITLLPQIVPVPCSFF